MFKKHPSRKQPSGSLVQQPLLTANWQYVLLVNYEIAPAILEPLLPEGLELDFWEGKALVSVVGLQFTKTRLLGALPAPLHTRFDQVNLRFYARPRGGAAETDGEGGVVFVKQINPKPWIRWAARLVLGEKLASLPVRHTFETRDGKLRQEGLVEYCWRYQGRLNRLGGLALGDAQISPSESEAAFVTERYWGYTRRGGQTSVYHVAHPAWRIWPVAQPYLLCDVKALYGAAFEPFLRQRPRSAFLAAGSPVAVFPPRALKA